MVPGQLIGHQRPTATPDPPTGWAPPGAMPSKDALTYWKEAVTVLLLFLALPWLVWKLLTDPGRVLAGAARQHVKA